MNDNSKSVLLWENSGSSQLYLKTRPPYEDRVLPWVLKYYHSRRPDASNISLAVDVGCGSGQLTTRLAPHCGEVIAVDASDSQIEVARGHSQRSNVFYFVEKAESLSNVCEPGKADLVIAGESAHFFDTDKFFGEARAILKPGGVIALVGFYLRGYVHEAEYYQNAIDDFMEMQYAQQPQYSLALKRLKESYKSIDCPLDDVQHFEDVVDFPWTREMTIGCFDSAKGSHLYPNDKVPFPGHDEDPAATAVVRMNIFALIGHT